MATFQYKAHREDQTAVEGRVEAGDPEAARLLLEQQGLVVASIHQVDVGQAPGDVPPAVSSPTQSADAERLALRRQFGRVLETGRPLAPALFAYAQELPAGRPRRRLEHVANQLEQGHDPSHELAAGRIDEQWMPLLSASASSGDPSQMLSGIIDESQRAGDRRRQFVGALAYPLLLVVFVLALISLFAWWLIPAFEEIFDDFGTEYPDLTRMVFGISRAIRQTGGLVILIPVFLLAAILVYFRVGPRSGFREWVVQRIPIIGATVRFSDKARFTRCLADLMEAEVPVADALRISGRNTGQAELRQAANRLATELNSGAAESPGSASFRRTLSHTVIHVLQLKDNPRTAAQILRELSWMYDQQTSSRLAWISSISSPLFVVVLGTVVGLYVVALFMPLIALIQNL